MNDLDNELSTTDKSMADLKSKLAQMELENKSLKAAGEAADRNTLDSQSQQTLNDRCERLEEQYLQMYQDNLGLDAALKADGSDRAK